MNFQDYQNRPSSEKITLATLDASKRLMGWELHSGSVYKITGITFSKILSVEDSGSAYTEAASVGAVTAGKYYLDRAEQTLYLRVSNSGNPNSRFIVATFRFFFANVPVVLPHDLASGFDVYWEPWISDTSDFGVEIDTINQKSEGIEGSGNLSLLNDQEFWPTWYDKLTYENKQCSIYSYNRDLEASEAKLIFRGVVDKRTYDSKTIKFSLKDLLSELQTLITLANVQDLEERNPTNLNLAKQRLIFGRVFGHLPVNLDAVNEGYPLTGTVALTTGSTTVTGTGTSFLSQLSPDDTLVIAGEEYTVATVTSNTSLEITDEYSLGPISGESVTLIPEAPKRFINRVWKVAGHSIREPLVTTLGQCTSTKLNVTSTADMFAGDTIYVGDLGSGEIAIIESVLNAQSIELATSLNVTPGEDVEVRRPAVQNVRLNKVPLIYYRDYTVDAENALIELRTTAESNASSIRQMSTNLVFVNGSRVVTGTGLDAIIRPGYMVGVINNADFFEVLGVSETELTLRTAATFGANTTGRFKPLEFSEDDVLSCDVLGRTLDGTPDGALIRDGPTIVKTLLTDLGLTNLLDTASFTEASVDANADIGMVIPESMSDTKTPSYRDAINLVSKSINGALVQTEAFNLKYFIIQPNKSATALRLREEDILSFKVSSTSENMVKTVIVQYQPREYDYQTGEESVRTNQTTSDNANYILKTDRTRTLSTKLVEEQDSDIYAARWALILETSAGVVSFETKLQGARLEVGDIIDLEHRKLFVRFGGTDSRRIMMVEKVLKNGSSVSIEAVDLSNCFNRVATISASSTEFISASNDERLYSGYITDEFGMIDNDPDTFGSNLIY